MANPEHLQKLDEGVDAWNKWQEQYNNRWQPTRPNLRGIHKISSSVFTGINFANTDLDRATFDGVRLEGTTFVQASLKNANLSGCYLDGANFSSANLSGASLYYAKVNGAVFSGANLSNADLRNCEGLRFDDTNIRHARLNPRPGNFCQRIKPWFIFNPVTDPWSELRREYTGPNFLLTLLALVAFLIPYIFQIAVWRGVNLTQNFLETSLIEIEDEYQRLVSQNLIAVPNTLEPTIDGLRRLDSCLAETCINYKVWQLLIGWHQGWMFTLLTVTIIIYNVIRFYLTQTVSAYRDEEERSGYTPKLSEYLTPNRFGISLARLHVVLRMLFFVAFISFLVNLGISLWLDVKLPASM
jgi:uncharacterized protein YjbI with pentapeptide repeats